MSHEWFDEDICTVLQKQPSRGSLLKSASTRYFEALRLHEIPAPIVEETNRSHTIQKAMQQHDLEATIATPQSSCDCKCINITAITTCPKCGCTTNLHLLNTADGAIDTSWDTTFGELVQTALVV
uniref:tRNA modification GTPase MnmE n=1 Tax=Lygus hesperus TaxID=30085 RepID=A0A0A9Y8R7_LYGHE